MSDWEVFTLELEQKYDAEIAEQISTNVTSFKEACKLNDLDCEGIITWEDFIDVLDTLDLKFTDSHM